MVKGRFLALLLWSYSWSASALIFPLSPGADGGYDGNFNLLTLYAPVWKTNRHAVYNLQSQNAVGVAPRWFLTAWHVAKDLVETDFVNDDTARYFFREKIDLGNDLALVKVDRPIPFYSKLQKVPGGVGDILTVYGQSGVPVEPILDAQGAAKGWKFAEPRNLRLRWGRGRRLDASPSSIQWDFTNNDLGLGAGGLNCAAVNTNDSGGGIFVGEELVGIITGLGTVGFRTDTNAIPTGDCDNPSGHIYDPSTLYRCATAAHPFTRGYGAAVYNPLSNILSHIAPKILLNVGGSTVDNATGSWQATPLCDTCTNSVDTVAEPIDRSGITNAAPDAVYRTAVYIQQAVTNALTYMAEELLIYERYRVRLHFAGIFPATAPDVCLESIAVNDRSQLFDPYQGVRRASVFTMDGVVPDENGRISIEVRPANAGGNALLCGIEISLSDSEPSPPRDFRWESISRVPAISSLNDVWWANGRFVAAAGTALLFSDDDGLSWQYASNVPSYNYSALSYGNGLWVALHRSSTVLTSEDGTRWTEHMDTSVSNGNLDRIAFGNGRFVAIGPRAVSVSLNGMNWQSQVMFQNLSRIAFCNGLFILPVSPSSLLVSSNGLDWTKVTPQLPQADPACSVDCLHWTQLGDIFAGSDAFVLTATASSPDTAPAFKIASAILTSADGYNWVEPANKRFGGTAGWKGYAHGNYLFPNQHLVSQDLRTLSPMGSGWEFANAVAFGVSNYVTVGAAPSLVFARNRDFGPLERIDHAPGSEQRPRVAVSGQALVIVNPQPGLPIPLTVSQTSGASFEPVDLPPGINYLTDVSYAQGRFVAVGLMGAAIHSSTGTQWQRSEIESSDNFIQVLYANGSWLALSREGHVFRSDDGTRFTLAASLDKPLSKIAFGNGLFVGVGPDGVAATSSSNASDWTFHNVAAVDMNSVTFGGDRFVAVGDSGFVQVSTDGIHWQQARASGGHLESVEFSDGTFVTIDVVNKSAFASKDGVTWVHISMPASALEVLVAGGHFWITGASATTALAQDGSNLNLPLRPFVDGDGSFGIRFYAPFNGLYRIMSTTDISTNKWDVILDLPRSNLSEVSWKFDHRLEGQRFFQVRRP